VLRKSSSRMTNLMTKLMSMNVVRTRKKMQMILLRSKKMMKKSN
jgi:hypothetical protein